MTTEKTDGEESRIVQYPMQFFLRALRDHPWKTVLMFGAEALQAVFTLMLPYAVRELINTAVAFHRGSGDFWAAVGDPLRAFIILAVLLAVSARVSGLALALYAPVLRVKARRRLIDHLQKHALDYFQSSHSGSIGNKINEACNNLGFMLWCIAFDVWPVLIKFLVSAALLALAGPALGMVMLAWTFVYLATMGYFSVIQTRMMEKISASRSAITGQVVDMAANIHAVKSYANERVEAAILEGAGQDEVRAIARFQFVREASAWAHFALSTGILVTLVLMALHAYERGTMGVGDIAFVFSLIFLVTEQCRGFVWGLTHSLEYFGQMADGVKTIMVSHALEDEGGAADLEAAEPSIRFEGVEFVYPNAQDSRVLKNFDLEVPARQKLGIIGPSGAGKSTVVALLLRFYDVTGGRILIGDRDIAAVTQGSLRRAVSVIPQDTSLFHRTLMENIRYGRLDATDDEVVEAARRAHAHAYIEKLPDGYHTLVGERGVKLSGGQRQRIAIARAILKNAPILVLDEATSALDSESEKLIQESLKDLMEGKTVIAIAHRLSTIAHLDRLIVMDRGRIVEDGSHKELLRRKGLYARLWSLQSGGFLQEEIL